MKYHEGDIVRVNTDIDSLNLKQGKKLFVEYEETDKDSEQEYVICSWLQNRRSVQAKIAKNLLDPVSTRNLYVGQLKSLIEELPDDYSITIENKPYITGVVLMEKDVNNKTVKLIL